MTGLLQLLGLVREGLSEVTTAVAVGNEKDRLGRELKAGCASAKTLGWMFEGEGKAMGLEGLKDRRLLVGTTQGTVGRGGLR